MLSAGQRGFRTVQFFYLSLGYQDRKRLRFAPPNSKPRPLMRNLNNPSVLIAPPVLSLRINSSGVTRWSFFQYFKQLRIFKNNGQRITRCYTERPAGDAGSSFMALLSQIPAVRSAYTRAVSANMYAVTEKEIIKWKILKI